MTQISVDPRLIQIAIESAPSVIALMKGLFHKANPNDPIPTDEEVIAAEHVAIEQSLARDADILRRHPHQS